MAKKGKKKNVKDDPAASRPEIDAVKGFIVVMFILILALGVFIIITRGQLDEFETAIALSKSQTKKVGTKSLDVMSFLALIKGSEESLLMSAAPENFFKRIYQNQEVGINEDDVTLEPVSRNYDRRGKFTQISWDIDIDNIDRRKAALFLHGVEANSPKARIIEMVLRRNTGKNAPRDSWDGSFKAGYRVAGDATKD